MKSYRPVSMGILLLFLLPAPLPGADPAMGPAERSVESPLPPAAQEPAAFLAWLNARRRAAGAPGLEVDPILEATAFDYAARLLALGRLSHRDPEGGNALTRYRGHGGVSGRVGEVLGAGPTLAEVQAAWWNSPSHRAVLLRPEWTHAGLGRASGEAGNVWVALFTARLTSAPGRGCPAD